MRIGVYGGGNVGARALALKAKYLSETVPGAELLMKPSDVKGHDVLLNFVIEEVPKFEASKRFSGYGQQVCLFCGNTIDYGDEELASLLVWLNKVHFIGQSPYHHDRIVSIVRRWFSPAVARRMCNQLHRVYAAVPGMSLFGPGEADPYRWMIASNRVATHQKRIDLSFEVTKQASALVSMKHKETPRVDMLVADQEKARLKMDQVGWDASHVSLLDAIPDREVYAEQVRKYGLFVSTSESESFGNMALELLLSGSVGVFMEAEWIRKLLPGYRYVASVREMPSMIARVVEDYEAARKYVSDGVIPYIVERYSWAAFAQGVEDLSKRVNPRT